MWAGSRELEVCDRLAAVVPSGGSGRRRLRGRGCAQLHGVEHTASCGTMGKSGQQRLRIFLSASAVVLGMRRAGNDFVMLMVSG
eukprot:scaffold16430_cov71-Phaeocystis_antarctica.AAC.8